MTLTIPASSLRDEEAAAADPLEVGALSDGFGALSIDADMIACQWDGSPVDYGGRGRASRAR